MSLLPVLSAQVLTFDTSGAVLNYGLEKVRFPAPVRLPARIRCRVALGDVADVTGGKRVTLHYVVDVEGQPKPACVAEALVMLSAL